MERKQSLEQRLIATATSDKLKRLHTPNQNGYLSEQSRKTLCGETKECLVSLDLRDKVHELYWIEGKREPVGGDRVDVWPNKFYVIEYEKDISQISKSIPYDGLFGLIKRSEKRYSNLFSTRKPILTGMVSLGFGVLAGTIAALLTKNIDSVYGASIGTVVALNTPQTVLGIRAYKKQKELIKFYNGLAAGNQR